MAGECGDLTVMKEATEDWTQSPVAVSIEAATLAMENHMKYDFQDGDKIEIIKVANGWTWQIITRQGVIHHPGNIFDSYKTVSDAARSVALAFTEKFR